ncbi:MAG: DUF6113 family protein [Sporichthyaceae bacterium]
MGKPKTAAPPKQAQPTPAAAPRWPKNVQPRWMGFVACLGIAALGALLGLFTSFAHAQRAGGIIVGLPVTLAAEAALVGAAGVVFRSRTAAAAATFGWMVTAAVFGSPRPEGDLVVSGDLAGVAYFGVGVIALVGLSLLPYHRLPNPRSVGKSDTGGGG